MTALVRVPDQIVTPARDRAWVQLFDPAVKFAQHIAGTEFVPAGLRNNVPAITAAILYGDEIGLEPMTALSLIAVIDGKPYVAAEALRALILAAGHQLWLDEATTERVTWAGQRTGSDKVTRITWTMQDARTAGIAGKRNWRDHPRPMLSARSSAELARAQFADVIHGLGAIEEYEDTWGVRVDPGNIAPTDSGASSNKRRRRAAQMPAPTLPAPEPIEEPESPPAVPARAVTHDEPHAPAQPPPLPGEITDTAPAHLTGAQRRKILAMFGEKGVKGTGSRKARLQLLSDWTGRPVLSGDDLTFREASTVIDELTRWEGVK